MLGILQTIIFFVALIGILVFVHEGGHFAFAKLFGVRVHVFSLGFGPKLLGFRRGETLYKISAVPLGGYVKMLGEDPSEEVRPEDAGRAFNDQPVWQRTLIILGGPSLNLIFPLLIHFAVGLGNTSVAPAEIGYVLTGSPAAEAGLRPGDVLEEVDGEPVGSFSEMVAAIKPRPGERLSLSVRRGDGTFSTEIVPEPTAVTILLDERETVGRIGVTGAYLPAVIGITGEGSPAERAGLESFDRVVSIDGEPLRRFVDVERAVLAAAGRELSLEVRRMREDARPPFDDPYREEKIGLRLPVPPDLDEIERIGIAPGKDFVAHVDPEGAAAAIGLKKGDRLVGLDGREMGMVSLLSELNSHPDVDHVLSWSRDGQRHSVEYRPRFIPAGEAKELGLARDAYDKGFWAFGGEMVHPEKVDNPAPIASAARYSWSETSRAFEMTFLGLSKLITGELSFRTLGGPIMIGQLAGMAGRESATSFFWMMALISINLGLINLFPIPVLDGGHLVFLGLEAVRRRPLSRALREKVMLVGLMLILLLFVFVTWNDVQRLGYDWTEGETAPADSGSSGDGERK
jgi:regulator of sigma E protease